MCRFTPPPVLVALVSVPTERFVMVGVRFWSTTSFVPNAIVVATVGGLAAYDTRYSAQIELERSAI